MGTSEDGTPELDFEADDAISLQSDNSPCEDEQIYVSVFDPIGEPAFKPSKTKPLPKWMSLLPSNVERERKRQRQSGSQHNIGSNFEKHQDAMKYTNDDGAITSKVPPKQHPASLRDRLRSEDNSPPIDIPKIQKRARNISFADDELNTDPRAFGRSLTLDSVYATPPEFPRRLPTPFPKLSRPYLDRRESSSYFSHNANRSQRPNIQEEDSFLHKWQYPLQSADLPTNVLSPVSAMSRPANSTLQSSEYLDRYQPKKLSTVQKRYVSKDPAPILERFRRQNIAKDRADSTGRSGSSGSLDLQKSVKSKQGDDIDPKRQDLEEELRELFREK